MEFVSARTKRFMSDDQFAEPMLFLPHAVVSRLIHLGGGVPTGQRKTSQRCSPPDLGEERPVDQAAAENWLKHAKILRG